jgi:hypothetical protein
VALCPDQQITVSAVSHLTKRGFLDELSGQCVDGPVRTLLCAVSHVWELHICYERLWDLCSEFEQQFNTGFVAAAEAGLQTR